MALASPAAAENARNARKFEVHVGADYVGILTPEASTDDLTARIFGDDAENVAHLFAASQDMRTQLEANEALFIVLLKWIDTPRPRRECAESLRNQINGALRTTQAAIAATLPPIEPREATDEEDEGWPLDDPGCMGNAGDCRDACERPSVQA